MEIDISQNKISVGAKYQIYIDGHQAYSASSKLLRIFDEVHLFEHEADEPKYIIKKKWAFFYAYSIKTQNDDLFQFRTKRFLKEHYFCTVGDDTYDIFAHKDRKYSIFKNDAQVAWWDKKAVSFLYGNDYKIIAHSTCNYELIITFCLIIDNALSKNTGNATITIDFGNLLQVKEFDDTWQPE